MERVVIVTGGGSGMGKAAISFLDPAKRIVISGRHLDKLQKTADEMAEKGHSVVPFVCDTSDRESVKELAAFAAGLGEITNVIQCAGVSPAMAEPEQIVRINALGTVYVNQELSRVMKPGSVICDVASNSAYQLPRSSCPRGLSAGGLCLCDFQELCDLVCVPVCLPIRSEGDPRLFRKSGTY